MGYEEQKIEGRNAVLEAFRSGKTIDKLFVLDGCQDGPVRTIVREARKHDTIINFVDKERLDQLSETKKHQGVIAVAAATEETDTNSLLGKAGSYYARIVFSYELVGNSSAQGANLVAQGTDCGGSIEVFNTAEDAEKRSVYLGAFDGTVFASGSHTVIGTVLVRTSDKLTASQQKELEANIIEILTTVS